MLSSNAEFQSAEWHCTEYLMLSDCTYAICHYFVFFMLNVSMLSIVKMTFSVLNIVILNSYYCYDEIILLSVVMMTVALLIVLAPR